MVEVETVTEAGSCQPATGSGTSQRARLSASSWSGTVPTTVIRPAPAALRGHRGPAAQVRVDVAGQDLGTVGLEELGDEGGRTGERIAAHRYGVGEVGQLVVTDAGRLAQHRGLPLLARSRLRVGVRRARAEHEVTAALGVGREEVQVLVGGRVERGDDEHGIALGRLLRRQLTAA